ncbi:MIP/aquaporin family protein [Flammeovirgaceae bacterium SG7u.111]|nr:MIP/aquaporin family protein [Flammeovirgaceae bacterium SG7u.132]WPO37789.1 MIP/aquaporin family protein [Flammeovirgaceae bacterium SG7u.111]
MSEFTAELIGTMLLILLGGSVNANTSLKATYGNSSGWIVTSLGWGFSVYVGVAVAGPFSGAHLNPAVSIGLATAGKFAWSSVWLFVSAQMIGAMLGAFLVWFNFRTHFDATSDKGTKLGIFCTGPAIKNMFTNLINEATGTFVLVFVVLYFTQPEFSADGIENGKIGLGSLGALPVALLVVVIGLGLGGTTGYAINPARDLGPRIVHTIMPIKDKGDSNWGYAWIPIAGPIAGGVLAALLAGLLA